jgi:hypothetical protein
MGVAAILLSYIKGIKQQPIGFLNGLRALKFISIGWRRYPTVIYFQQQSQCGISEAQTMQGRQEETCQHDRSKIHHKTVTFQCFIIFVSL